MTRSEKKMLIWTIELGLLITLGVIIADGFGGLDWFERILYDSRAQRCQFFMPPPTDRIVHLDIDDPTLKEIGSFPWRRRKLAAMIDEIHAAGAKVISTDILFAEPQDPEIVQVGENKYERIDDDAKFAEAIKRAGNVLLPVSVNLETERVSPTYTAVYQALLKNLEFSPARVSEQLRGTPVDGAGLSRRVAEVFSSARAEAAFNRIYDLLGARDLDLTQLAAELLPEAAGQHTEAFFELKEALPRAQAVRLVMQRTAPIPEGLPPLLTADSETAITIPVLMEAATYSTTPEFNPDPDGAVRRVPLVINYRGQLFPHTSLLTACAQLGVALKEIKCSRSRIVLPLPDGKEIRIPVQTVRSPRFGEVGMFMNIPWFGKGQWQTMYDTSHHTEFMQHVPLRNVWTNCQLIDDIKQNEREADAALLSAVKTFSSDKAAAFINKAPEARTNEERWPAIDESIKTLDELMDPTLLQAKPSELKPDDLQFVAAYKALKKAKSVNESEVRQLNDSRASLRSQLVGRSVIIGFTATGRLDSYPTSLHPECPGAVILGVAFNGIVNRELWWNAPWWMTMIITLIVGTLTTLAAAYLEPRAAAASTIGLMAAYFVLNGIVLFDYGNTIFGVAAPLTSAFLCWSSLTILRYISDITQRRRIENRFRSYVDPELVDFVKENEDTARIDGQLKTMTVVFTDLAGFTSISEKLRERTVPLLNRYMSLMLPIIRKNRGLWNKFLGDGIMFFFNAPRDNPDHARDAVRAVMDMQQALIGFNEELQTQDLPKVSMRAGISTGPMIVGDAGSTDAVHGASDYTVLGDEVNLGARLESANKYLGSKTLLNEQAAKMCGDEFLLRPMGNLCVVGKTEGVMTYEAICRVSEATPEQKRVAELSKKIVDAFRSGDFGWCLEAAKSLEKEFGSSKFTELYLNLAQVYLVEPPGDKFDGQIVLSEK